MGFYKYASGPFTCRQNQINIARKSSKHLPFDDDLHILFNMGSVEEILYCYPKIYSYKQLVSGFILVGNLDFVINAWWWTNVSLM